jgi:hypothetical protein
MSGGKREVSNERHITLSSFLNRDGSSNTHKKVMTKKSVIYAEAIAQTNFWSEYIGMAYNSFYTTIFSYGAQEASIFYKECDELKKPVVNAILPKMGINRNTSRALTFATSNVGGLGLDNIEAVQVFGWMQYLMAHLRF